MFTPSVRLQIVMVDFRNDERVVTVAGRAWAALFQAMPLADRLPLGARADTCGPAHVLRCAGVETPLMNRAFGIGLHQMASEALIDSITGRFHAAGIGGYFLQIADPAVPRPGLSAWLAARGLVPFHRRWVQLVRGDQPPPPADTALHVRSAHPDEARVVGHVLSAGFELPARALPIFSAMVRAPGWRSYVAVDDGTVVAAAAMFTSGDVAYLAGAATLPDHRGRHAQGALMSRRIADARAHGCRLMITETGEPIPGQPSPSLHNMLRCGFRPAYLVQNWCPPGTTWLPRPARHFSA